MYRMVLSGSLCLRASRSSLPIYSLHWPWRRCRKTPCHEEADREALLVDGVSVIAVASGDEPGAVDPIPRLTLLAALRVAKHRTWATAFSAVFGVRTLFLDARS